MFENMNQKYIEIRFVLDICVWTKGSV